MTLSFSRSSAGWVAIFFLSAMLGFIVKPGRVQAQDCAYDTLNPTLDHARGFLQQQRYTCAERELQDILERVPPRDAATTACAHLLLAETYYWQQDRPDRSPQVDAQLSLAFAACRSCPCEMATTDARLSSIVQRARDGLSSDHEPQHRPRCSRLSSLLIPGLCEYKTGNRLKGVALLGGCALALGSSVGLTLKYNSSVDNYDAAWDTYRQAKDPEEATWAWHNANEWYKKVDNAEKLRNLVFVAVGVIYVVNAIDVLVFKPGGPGDNRQSSTDQSWYPAVGVFSGKVVLSWRW